VETGNLSQQLAHRASQGIGSLLSGVKRLSRIAIANAESLLHVSLDVCQAFNTEWWYAPGIGRRATGAAYRTIAAAAAVIEELDGLGPHLL
jgi:hypothetical protein